MAGNHPRAPSGTRGLARGCSGRMIIKLMADLTVNQHLGRLTATSVFLASAIVVIRLRNSAIPINFLFFVCCLLFRLSALSPRYSKEDGAFY